MFDFKTSKEKLFAKSEAGFLKAPSNTDVLSQIDSRKSQIRKNGFSLDTSYLVVIGIGGSSLGLRAVSDMLCSSNAKDAMILLESPDKEYFGQQIQKIKKSKKDFHLCVISKSGGTVETLTLCSRFLIEMNVSTANLKAQVTVITDSKTNPLRDWAQKNEVFCFDIPSDIGGRYSVLTTVGLFPLAMLGVDIESLLNGAKRALQNLSRVNELFDFTQPRLTQKSVILFWMYSRRLNSLGAWLQQLWAESLGKAKDLNSQLVKLVSSPMVLVGTNDQHSVLQQIVDGQKDKFALFFADLLSEEDSEAKVGEDFKGVDYIHGHSLGKILRAQRTATRKSLEQNGIDSMDVLVDDKRDEEKVGRLLMELMLLVSALGVSINVNPFDQPGVEGVKKLAKDLLSGS